MKKTQCPANKGQRCWGEGWGWGFKGYTIQKKNPKSEEK